MQQMRSSTRQCDKFEPMYVPLPQQSGFGQDLSMFDDALSEFSTESDISLSTGLWLATDAPRDLLMQDGACTGSANEWCLFVSDISTEAEETSHDRSFDSTSSRSRTSSSSERDHELPLTGQGPNEDFFTTCYPSGVVENEGLQHVRDAAARTSPDKLNMEVQHQNLRRLSTTSPRNSKADAESVSEADALVISAISKMMAKDQWRQTPKRRNTSNSRWWSQSQAPLLCPLTHFPICLLPYPPFKLRVDANKPFPHKLVDGKYLAMQLVVDSNFMACGRELQSSDLEALDEYIHRCKLGTWRPSRAQALKKEVANAMSQQQCMEAAYKLEHLRMGAQSELDRLARIQGNRLRELRKLAKSM